MNIKINNKNPLLFRLDFWCFRFHAGTEFRIDRLPLFIRSNRLSKPQLGIFPDQYSTRYGIMSNRIIVRIPHRMEISNQNISLSSRHFFFHTHKYCTKPVHIIVHQNQDTIYTYALCKTPHILMSRKDTKMNPKIYIFRTTPPGHRSPADDRPNIGTGFPAIYWKQASKHLEDIFHPYGKLVYICALGLSFGLNMCLIVFAMHKGETVYVDSNWPLLYAQEVHIIYMQYMLECAVEGCCLAKTCCFSHLNMWEYFVWWKVIVLFDFPISEERELLYRVAIPMGQRSYGVNRFFYTLSWEFRVAHERNWPH